jgi:hypothetical protein
MELGNRHEFYRVWAHHMSVQELARLLPLLPKPEFESQTQPRSHMLECASQLRRRQSHFRRDLGRMVYGHRIAMQASLRQLQHYKWFHRNLSCCQHHHMQFETQIVVSMQGFGYCQCQIRQTQTKRVS